MKTIALHIEDDVISELESELTLKSMANNAFGVEDAFIMRLLSALRADKPEMDVKFRNKQ